MLELITVTNISKQKILFPNKLSRESISFKYNADVKVSIGAKMF